MLRLLSCVGVSLALGATAGGEDWPTYRHDVSRTGTTAEELDATRLREAWVHRRPEAPRSAWPGPARWDAFAAIKNLPSMRNYDPCHHVVAVGNGVYFGSSTDDSVHRLNAHTGRVEWSFTADGPVRLAPTVDNGRVFFGSDDGAAYCVEASTGKLRWRHVVEPGERGLLNDGRVIATHPVRTGVVVRDGRAYFGASLLPWRESYLVAVDAETGEASGEGTFRHELDGHTLEGAMLATDTELILPQGRVAPVRFDRRTGESKGSLGGGGGVFAVITPDQHVLRQSGGRADRDGGLVGHARIAQYNRGHAILVSGRFGFVLDPDGVVGLDLEAGRELWRQRLDSPADLVLAGRTLFVGSRGRVTAFEGPSGRLQWEAEVPGTAHGLAVANGSLLVSTDAGTIHAFHEGPTPVPPPERAADATPESPVVQGVRARGLLGSWVFHRSAMRNADGTPVERRDFVDVTIADHAGGRHGRLVGPGRSIRVGDVEALECVGGTMVELATKRDGAPLPRRAFTAEAWVRIDETMPWGGIVGAVRDNGSDEQGWLLGLRNDRFCLGVRSTGAKSLTYLTTNQPIRVGDWAHVVGTYDGETMRLYVNGRIEATSDAQSGDLVYPESVHYVLAAYKDENEDYRLKGAIHEVRTYEIALRDRDVTALFRARAADFPEPTATPEERGNFLAFGPYLRFTGPRSAEVRWATDVPSTGVVEFLLDDERFRVASTEPTREHRVTVDGLRRNRVHQYRIVVEAYGQSRTTRTFECDTHFAYHDLSTTRVVPDPMRRAEVATIVERVPVERGFVVVLGDPEATLARELAIATDWNVVGVVEDADARRRERKQLVDEGLYGRRLTLTDGRSLPGRFANAVVLTEPDAANEATARELLQPGGRLVVGGEVRWTAPAIPGSGEWSHMYGRADNSSFGGESLANVGRTDDLEVQWIGRPGPRYQSDRQTRKPAPLAAGGRLYMQGLQRLITADQYNGTLLWSVEIPEMMRWNVPRDCANWCADDRRLYVAVLDELLILDGATGDLVRRLRAVGNEGPERTWDWGFVARSRDAIIGSSVRPGTSFTEWWAKENWYDQRDGERAAKVGSDRLFALDPETGRVHWQRTEGVVLNPTITLAESDEGSVLYFVESRNPAIVEAETRRLQSDELWTGLHVVGIDAATGEVRLDRPIAPMSGETAFYLVHAEGRLLLSSSSDNTFSLLCLDAGTGEQRWESRFPWQANHHGKHLARPAVSGQFVYLRPRVLELATGRVLDVTFPDGHQCGSYALTTNALIARAGDTMLWSVKDAAVTRWNRHRPDCWVSTIPAGGMLLSPEAGGGCSCGSWIETSIGWMPRVFRERKDER